MPLAREQRKLAAIVAADVVGYSRLMGRDESGTLARLRKNRSEHLEPVLTRYGGRLVKLAGDGVNIAARLEAEAPAGGILISRTVHEAVAGRVKATFDDLGSLALKNIERPVQAFSVKWEVSDWPLPVPSEATTAPATGPQEPLPMPDKPSVAVLPF